MASTPPASTAAPAARRKIPWLYWVVCLVFGGVFVYAGALKAWDPTRFLISIRSFHLLPDPYAAWLALWLPWMEILAGLAVISGVFRQGGLMLLNGALLIFAAALIMSWARGIDVDCGCFGGGGSSIVGALVRDIVLLVAGGWLWLKSVAK